MTARWRFAFAVFGLTAFVIALFALAGLALWSSVDRPQRALLEAVLAERLALLVILALLLGGVLGALLRWAQAAFPQAAARMAEEVNLIHGVNPAHRVTPVRSASLRRLGDAINAFADAHGRLQREVDVRIAEANRRLEEERNRLAALMSELAQSVLVCNREGRILLYNAGAAALLGDDAGVADGAPVGLGRSVFTIIDKSQIEHALDRVARRSVPPDPAPVAQFVTVRGEQLLRVQLAPVLDAQGDATAGFVLTLDDVTRAIASDTRREQLLRELTEGTRASLANIRAAVETMQQYRDMDAAQRQRFTDVIRDEAEQLSTRLAVAAAAAAETPSGPWPLEEMQARDFCHALQRSIERHLPVTAAQRGGEDTLWLRVDSHGLVHALTQATERLVGALGVRSVLIETGATGRFVAVSLCWRGPPLAAETLRAWEDEPFGAGRDGQRATLSQLLQRHGAEIWSRSDPAGGLSRLCLQLPGAAPADAPGESAPGAAPAAPAARPIYYDFDLFDQPGQTPELDARPLVELTYTVFDTETTGLSPSDGDEIISIGAVRVVNGRLLRQECFDRLIRPNVPLRRESQQVHGITMRMLEDQPDARQVLPAFRRFVEDTVLVAHNAAFDMRFLQLAQARAGVDFGQPVLDTLMLSALAHPGHPDAEHRLDRIAARLGVAVIGRHTALGDAIVTAEVFLKLIPLLAERGIHTLGQARAASQRTPYAKLDY